MTFKYTTKGTNLEVNMKPSSAMNRNCEKVIKFPTPGSSFTSSSKKTTLEQQPTKTSTIASVGPILLNQMLNKFSGGEE